MGNIGSQLGNSSQKYKLESDGQLSLPRIVTPFPQRVLPIEESPLKLRSTENGKVLYNGGTLTGRQHLKSSKGNYMNVKERISLIKEQHGINKCFINKEEQLKKADSEPDLRYLNQEQQSLKRKDLDELNPSKSRQEKPDVWFNNESCGKRIGIFKTRVQSRKQPFVIHNNRSPSAALRNKSNELETNNGNRSSLPELEIDTSLIETCSEFTDNNCIQRLNTDIERFSKEYTNTKNGKHESYLREVNMKKYYFGMANNAIDIEYLNYEAHNYRPTGLNTSVDDIGFNSIKNFEDDIDCFQKISLRLRPILPRKQLEVPKFSSDVAWKMLYSGDLDSNLRYNINNEEDLIEEKIEKVSTSPTGFVKLLDFQFNQEKSGDSGISGDRTPKLTLSHYKSKQSWTPQQDLGDDSSTDEEIKFNNIPYFNRKEPYIFSLSLSREHLSTQYERHKVNSHLQSTSVNAIRSGFGMNNCLNNGDKSSVDVYARKNCNWLLSKSAPNSLNNGFTSLDSTYAYNEAFSSLVPINNQHNTSRIMYLPRNHDSNEPCQNVKRKSKISKYTTQNGINNKKKHLSSDFLQEVERKEQERYKEIEIMQHTEAEFRRKRSRFYSACYNNHQNFHHAIVCREKKCVVCI